MARGIFISQEVLLCLVFFLLLFCFQRNSFAALHFPCTLSHPSEEGRRVPFFSKPSVGLSFSRFFDTGLSEKCEVIPHGGFDWPGFRR